MQEKDLRDLMLSNKLQLSAEAKYFGIMEEGCCQLQDEVM